MNNQVKIKYNYGMTKKNLLRASIYIALIIPVIIDTIRGFIKKPESAWLFHPIACLGELSIYVYNYIKSPFNIE